MKNFNEVTEKLYWLRNCNNTSWWKWNTRGI